MSDWWCRRSLAQWETDMLMFPRVCGSCSSHLAGGGEECPGCRVTVYCSAACREEDSQHSLHCENLRNNREDYLHSRTGQADNPHLTHFTRLDR